MGFWAVDDTQKNVSPRSSMSDMEIYHQLRNPSPFKYSPGRKSAAEIGRSLNVLVRSISLELYPIPLSLFALGTNFSEMRGKSF